MSSSATSVESSAAERHAASAPASCRGTAREPSATAFGLLRGRTELSKTPPQDVTPPGQVERLGFELGGASVELCIERGEELGAVGATHAALHASHAAVTAPLPGKRSTSSSVGSAPSILNTHTQKASGFAP